MCQSWTRWTRTRCRPKSAWVFGLRGAQGFGVSQSIMEKNFRGIQEISKGYLKFFSKFFRSQKKFCYTKIIPFLIFFLANFTIFETIILNFWPFTGNQAHAREPPGFRLWGNSGGPGGGLRWGQEERKKVIKSKRKLGTFWRTKMGSLS